MKIDFSKAIIGLDGEALTNQGKDHTLGSVAVDALMLMVDGQKPSGKESFKRHRLATKIYDKSDVDLSIEEIALLKKLIGNVFGPAVVGPAWNLLEGTNK